MNHPEPGQEEWPEVVVRDKRRIDPVTGEIRAAEADERPASGVAEDDTEPGVDAEPDELTQLRTQLEERTGDLQRVSAEYANYRRRVDRDRQLVITNAKAQVAGELLTVLDDLDRAEQHGDLTGAFKSVADKLVEALRGQGLEAFGAEGDPFDPDVHEAVQHTTSSEVDAPTVTAVLRHGYRFGERVLRPAMVGVTDVEAASGDSEPEASEAAQG